MSHSCINHSSGRGDVIERLSFPLVVLQPGEEASPLRPFTSDLLTATNQPVAMESFQPPALAKNGHNSSEVKYRKIMELRLVGDSISPM